MVVIRKRVPGRRRLLHPVPIRSKLYFGYRRSYRDLGTAAGPDAKPIPLYSRTGERTDAGEISCPTCHDPHVWYAKEKATGPGKNSEGTIVNSFLRTGARNDLCYACHGLTTLLLYRYYHNADEKKAIRGKNISRQEN